MTNFELRAIRHRLGLTQAELAEVVGYRLGGLHVSKYERYTNPLKVPPLLAKLLIAYDEGYRPSNWPEGK
ncbi:helix-turn-helix transcriptional regulator [Phyllobacterium sp. LjRoot231]|uniref:helix-turn-helix domain-containing protein n=1 Tax=Phyllobacterium sp. LjRoot231 TaxID=3342289 RepID=UPI003ED0427B